MIWSAIVIVIDHIAGSRRGQRQQLSAIDRVRFGRHPDNEVSFDAHRDLDASSRHAELVRDGSRYRLRDVGSSNGLWVDAERLGEAPIVIGVPADIAFGSVGPRVRLYIGSEDQIPDPPSMSASRFKAPGSGSASGSYSLRRMLSAARARAKSTTGVRRIQEMMRALGAEILDRSSRQFKIGLSLAVTVFVVLFVGLIAWRSEGACTGSTETPAFSSERATSERERALLAEASPTLLPDPAERTTAHAAAVVAFVAEAKDGSRRIVCAGVLVTADHAATTARCINTIATLRKARDRVFARRLYDDGDIRLHRWRSHAAFNGGPKYDVGFVKLAIASDVVVPLASEEVVTSIRRGLNLFALELQTADASGRVELGATLRARLHRGVAGHVTDAIGATQDATSWGLVQHNLPFAAYAIGAPVLDANGQVIALHAGAGAEHDHEMLAPGASYAVRIDALLALLRESGIDLFVAGQGL